MNKISKNRTFSLDVETIQMLERQAKELHLSRSAFIRLLLVRNEGKGRENEPQ